MDVDLKKVESIKKDIDKFKDKVLEKFEDYVLGIALLPPSKEKDKKENINLLILIDDSDSRKLTKEELHKKLNDIISDIAKKVNKKLNPEVLLISELWQMCFDGKTEMLQTIAISANIYDKGMLSAIKIAEIHKSMVLKKFEKYIVSYVLGGSLVQGKATPESDIDVFIVIDDTDVKKMTRTELKDKLRAIILSMGLEAGEITGIKNKLNIQVYILTDFWDYIKEASPVIFTFLRDGIPFYDRGIFMPWKQLLKMGRIKPSPEAIEMYKVSGEQMIERVDNKIKEIVVEDLFWATTTPSQAALMLYGVPPPTPKELSSVLKEVFVKKNKLLEEKYVKIIEKIIKIRKDVEHGLKKSISGKELDELYNNAKDYLKRLNKLFNEIEEEKEKENIINLYETALTLTRDALELIGVEKVSDKEIINIFESNLINTNKLPVRYFRLLKNIIKAKESFDKNELTRVEINKVNKEGKEFIKGLIEFIQRKKINMLEEIKLKVKYGKKEAEVILLEKEVFVIEDPKAEEPKIRKGKIEKDGSFKLTKDSNLEELEEAVKKSKGVINSIKEKSFESLKEIFGKNIEIKLN